MSESFGLLLALALATGMAATFNPCGVGLLPGYVGFLLADAPGGTRARLAWEGAAVGLVMTVGVIAPFVVLGMLFGPLAALAGTKLPAVGVAIGAAFAAWGLLLLCAPARFSLSFSLAPRDAGGRRGLPGAALYGFAFGLSSLGCAFPLFLSLLVQASAGGGPLRAAAVVSTYAIGMGLALAALSVAARLAGGWLRRLLHAGMPWFGYLRGAVVLASGLYIMAYWLLPF